MGFFRDIARDARLPAMPSSRSDSSGIGSNNLAGSMERSEMGAPPTDAVSANTKPLAENSSLPLSVPPQKPSRQNLVQQVSTPETESENSADISTETEVRIAGLKESHVGSQPFSGHADDVSDHWSEPETSGVTKNKLAPEAKAFVTGTSTEEASLQTVQGGSAPTLETASVAPTVAEKTQTAELNSVDGLPVEDVMPVRSGQVPSKDKAHVPMSEIRHSVMAEPDAAAEMKETGMSADFADFTRLSDTFQADTPVSEMLTETPHSVTEKVQVIQTPDSTMRVRSVTRTEHVAQAPEPADPVAPVSEMLTETPHSVTEKVQVIQTPDSTMRVRSVSRTEHVAQAPESAAPVAATIQQTDQWLAGGNRMNASVSGSGQKEAERQQQPRVKIGRIDVVIEGPAQKVSACVEQKQSSSTDFASRHYLRRV